MRRYCSDEAYEARRETPLPIRVDRILAGKCACGCGVELDSFI